LKFSFGRASVVVVVVLVVVVVVLVAVAVLVEPLPVFEGGALLGEAPEFEPEPLAEVSIPWALPGDEGVIFDGGA
jgi:hypothetical protein